MIMLMFDVTVQFLRENPEVFYVEGNLVTLVERPQEEMEASPDASHLNNIDEGSTGDNATPKKSAMFSHS